MTLGDARRMQALLDGLGATAEGDRVSRVADLLMTARPELRARRAAYREYAAVRPRPRAGEVVPISPPGFCWKTVDGAAAYRLQVFDAAGGVAWEHTGPHPAHLPSTVFEPGRWSWDVTALDSEGRSLGGRGRWAFSVAEDPTRLPWVAPAELIARVDAGHPRLLYRRKDLDGIRATLDSTRSRNWSACRAAADAALDVRPPTRPAYTNTPDRVTARLEAQAYLLDFERTMDVHFLDLCLAWLMTGDERYAAPAKDILLTVARWPPDERDATSLDSPWGDGVGLSLSRCLHRGYDWLHEALDDDERAVVRTACRTRARQAYRRLVRRDFLAAPGESHNGRLIVYLAEMAVVLAREEPEAERWLEYALLALTTLYPHWGGRDGGWAEGPAYGLWYGLLALPGLEAVARATDFDALDRPFFRRWPDFFVHCTALRATISPFGDGAEQVGPARDDRGLYALLLWYFAHRFGHAEAGWWCRQAAGGRGLVGELALLFPDEPPRSTPPGTGARAFRGAGWVALHGTPSDPDRDAFLLLRSSPFGSVSHGHADQNAFALFKGGRALVAPSGYFWPVAGMPHHTEWTRTTRAAPTVLVDGRGQRLGARDARGGVAAFDSGPGWARASCEAGEAYGEPVVRFTRHVLMLPPDVFVLVDELEAREAAAWSWLLHGPSRFEVDPERGRIAVENRPATLDVHIRATTRLAFHQTDAFDVPPHAGVPHRFRIPMPDQWHLRAVNPEPVSSLRIATVMVTGTRSRPTSHRLLDHDGWLGVALTGDDDGSWVAVRADAGAAASPHASSDPPPPIRFRGVARGQEFEI